MPKVLIWDIETSNLDADWGSILAIGYKWLGEKKIHVLAATDYKAFKKDPNNDKGIVKDFLKIYEQADVTVAFNGALFDRPYLIAKVLEHDLPIPPNIPLQDPYFTVRANLKIRYKSLQNTSYYLRLKSEKTPVEKRIWRRAMVGHAPSVKYIVEHCRADVQVLEELYLKLRPLMRAHFRLSDDLGKCRFCNSARLQSRGKSVSKTKGTLKRVQCQECSGWDTRSLKEIEKFKLKEKK